MDNQAYLNQIAASNRPEKTPKFSGILKNNIFKIGAIVVGLFILIFIIGQILSGIKGDTKQDFFDFKVRLDNTSKTLKQYQGLVKSSRLRSYSASLATIVSSTAKATDNYAAKVYPKVKITGSETITKSAEELENDLHNAKINGFLDRVFARKLTYEISVIMADESKLIKSIKDEEYKKALQSSYDSLSVIKDSFASFSETK
jgi:hypothetical protein